MKKEHIRKKAHVTIFPLIKLMCEGGYKKSASF